MNDPIVDSLFSTNAIRVSDPEAPFWYASGMLGPFYINTHFLLESEMEAVRLLSIIETASGSDRFAMPKILLDHLLAFYEKSASFRQVTDAIVDACRNKVFDFISGGERRDYFFSIVPAYLLKKPHLFIFKDFQSIYSNETMTDCVMATEVDLDGKVALHIADLVTEASSYMRVWVPVIKNLGASITDTVAVVDRVQGGREDLAAEGISLYTLTAIDNQLFEKAVGMQLMSNDQYQMVLDYMKDPDAYVRAFFASHPDYVSEQIKLGGKAKERAELAISKGYAESVCDV